MECLLFNRYPFPNVLSVGSIDFQNRWNVYCLLIHKLSAESERRVYLIWVEWVISFNEAQQCELLWDAFSADAMWVADGGTNKREAVFPRRNPHESSERGSNRAAREGGCLVADLLVRNSGGEWQLQRQEETSQDLVHTREYSELPARTSCFGSGMRTPTMKRIAVLLFRCSFVSVPWRGGTTAVIGIKRRQESFFPSRNHTMSAMK